MSTTCIPSENIRHKSHQKSTYLRDTEHAHEEIKAGPAGVAEVNVVCRLLVDSTNDCHGFCKSCVCAQSWTSPHVPSDSHADNVRVELRRTGRTDVALSDDVDMRAHLQLRGGGRCCRHVTWVVASLELTSPLT